MKTFEDLIVISKEDFVNLNNLNTMLGSIKYIEPKTYPLIEFIKESWEHGFETGVDAEEYGFTNEAINSIFDEFMVKEIE